jgi:hypothetical protein
MPVLKTMGIVLVTAFAAFLYGSVPQEHGLRTEVRDQSGRLVQLPWSMDSAAMLERAEIFVHGNKTGPFLLEHLKRHRPPFKNSFPWVHPTPF